MLKKPQCEASALLEAVDNKPRKFTFKCVFAKFTVGSEHRTKPKVFERGTARTNFLDSSVKNRR